MQAVHAIATSCLKTEEAEGDHSTGALSLLSRTLVGVALREPSFPAIRCIIAKFAFRHYHCFVHSRVQRLLNKYQ